MRIDVEEVIISRIWDNHGKEIGYEQKGVLVRCKDCKHWSEYMEGIGVCDKLKTDTGEEVFCSYGESKDGSGNTKG